MIQLRPFQGELIEKTRHELRSSSSVLVQLPTGGGKTIIAAFMIMSALSKGLRVWFICHRDFLVDQTSQTLASLGVEHSFVSAGRPFNPAHPMLVCSIDTVKNRLDRLKPPHLVIWDECHHVAAAGWVKVRAWAAKSKHVGLSATPCRLDGKGLDDVFDVMVKGPHPEWLIDQGYLSKFRAFAPSEVDLAGIKKRGGDFVTSDLERAMDTVDLVGDLVENYQRLAAGLRAVYFCVSIKHSQHVAAAFNAAGVPAMHLDGSAGSLERAIAARNLADGKLQVLTNVALFGEGYDLAAQAGRPVAIKCVGVARPTASLALHLQQCGRGLRPDGTDQDAILIDHAGNLMRHGLPDEEREWSLQGVEKKQDEAGGAKRCPECQGVHKAGPPRCPYCGHSYKEEAGDGAGKQTTVKVNDGELVEVNREMLKRQRAQEEGQCRGVEDLIKLGRERGYASPERWAAHKWSARQAGRERSGQRRAEEQARQQRLW